MQVLACNVVEGRCRLRVSLKKTKSEAEPQTNTN